MNNITPQTLSDTIDPQTGRVTLSAKDKYENLRNAFLRLFEQSGRPSTTPYFDTHNPPIITIGIGFNLEDRDVRNAVLMAMFPHDTGIRQAIINTITTNTQQIQTYRRNNDNAGLTAYLTSIVQQIDPTEDFVMTQTQIDTAYSNILAPIDRNTCRLANIAATDYSVERAILTSLRYIGAFGNRLRDAVYSSQTPDY